MFWAVARALLFCTLLDQAAGGAEDCPPASFFSTRVEPLCESRFPQEHTKNIWIIQFYHPRIKKVHESRAAFEQLAIDAPHDIKVGAVDCSQNAEFCVKHSIIEAPTTKAVAAGAFARVFQGSHTLSALNEFVEAYVARLDEIDERLKCNIKGLYYEQDTDPVIPLCTHTSFPLPVESIPWMVLFYNKWEHKYDKPFRKKIGHVGKYFGSVSPDKFKKKRRKPTVIQFGTVGCNFDGNDCKALGVDTYPQFRFYRTATEFRDYGNDHWFDEPELISWLETQLEDVKMALPYTPEGLKPDMPEEDVSKEEL